MSPAITPSPAQDKVRLTLELASLRKLAAPNAEQQTRMVKCRAALEKMTATETHVRSFNRTRNH